MGPVTVRPRPSSLKTPHPPPFAAAGRDWRHATHFHFALVIIAETVMFLEMISPEKNKCCVSMVEDVAKADGSVELNFREVEAGDDFNEDIQRGFFGKKINP